MQINIIIIPVYVLNKKLKIKFNKVKISNLKRNINGGALLFELLIVISLLAIILFFGANAIFLSMKSNSISGERDHAYLLANESLEAARSITEENWQNIYSLSKDSTHYQTVQSGGKWVFSVGDETIVFNNVTYTRYVTIDSVSRDNTTRNILGSYSSIYDDPNTQKITVNVSWTNSTPVTESGYLFRWKNKICLQTVWTTQTTPTDTSVSCNPTPTTNYFSKDAGIDTSVSGQLGLVGTSPKAVTGTLISSVFDSGINTGIGFNSIMWKGQLGGSGLNEGKVRFQLAGSSNVSGPWNYYGGDTCGSSDWFDPGASETPIELKGFICTSVWNNVRYYRYKVQICSSSDCATAGNNSPTVNDIIINWVP